MVSDPSLYCLLSSQTYMDLLIPPMPNIFLPVCYHIPGSASLPLSLPNNLFWG